MADITGNPTPLNVPAATPVAPTPAAVAGTPAVPQVVTPPAATPDLLRQQGISGHTPQSPSIPQGPPAGQTLGSSATIDQQGAAPQSIAKNLVRATTNGIASGTESPRATPVGLPTPPTITTGLVRASQNGIAAGTENPRATPIGVPATPGIMSSTTPVAVGDPTLATAAPLQAPNAPRVAGIQLVSPTPPAVQTASQLNQGVNAPQVLSGISTMMQKA